MISDTQDEWPWGGEEEQLLDDAIAKAMNSKSSEDIKEHLNHFLELCHSFAERENPSLQCLVYTRVAYAYAHGCNSFAVPPEQSLVWKQVILEWVEKEAAIVTEIDRRSALCIAILEPMVDEPIYDYDIDWLMGLLQDNRTIWAVIWAFDSEEFPANFVAQYEYYVNRQLRRGLRPACYPEAQKPEWIMTHRDS